MVTFTNSSNCAGSRNTNPDSQHAQPISAAPRSLSKVLPAAIIGTIAGIDNIAAALAMSALIFTGSLSPGMGLGVGVILLGGALLAIFVALRSTVPNNIALVQETTIAILAAAISTMALTSSGSTEEKVATAIAIIGVSSLVTGVLFWMTGRFKIGGLTRFLPYPVVAGFLAGSGWLLVDGASIMLTGRSVGMGVIEALRDPNIILRTIPATIFAVCLLVTLRIFRNSITMPLVIIISASCFYSSLFLGDISIEAARKSGHLPHLNESGGIELPTFTLLSQIDWPAVVSATPTILVVAGLSMIGLMLNVSGLELALGRDIDVNSELRASGLANIFSGAVGGPSGYVGLSMTVLAEKTGATERSAGIATSAVMLIGLFAAGSLIYSVPIFITAGFILFLGIELLKEWFFDTYRQLMTSEWLIILTILVTIILVGFMEGLAVGLIVSSALFVFNYSRQPVVRIRATGSEKRSSVDRSPAAIKYLSDHGDEIEFIKLQGYLFFGTADRVVDLVRYRLAEINHKPLKFIVLDFQYVSGVDSAAISCVFKIRNMVIAENVIVYFVDVSEDLKRHFHLAGVDFENDPLLAIDVDADYALEKAEEFILGNQAGLYSDASLIHHFTAAIGQHSRFPDLINRMTELQLWPGDVLIKQGEIAEDVFFIATGRVRIQITLPDGKVLRLRTMLGGAIVGEIGLYLHQTRTADVIVDAPSAIFRLSAAELEQMEREDGELASLVHQLLATNLAEKLSVANRMIQTAAH